MAIIHHLPPEILTDILLRLPIKTLSIAKLVNKYWLQFISSSDFVRAHLKNSTLSDHRVIYPPLGPFLKQFSIDTLLPDATIDLISNVGSWTWLDARLVGSCNGLVCLLSTKRHILIMNPCTGKYYNKSHPLDVERRGCRLDVTYGFGYDESNDDYKVVAVWNLHHDYQSYCSTSMVKVYSLKSNSWKRIEDFKDGVLGSAVGKLVNGKLHWLTDYRYDENFRRKIVSFDVGSEVFGIVEQPSWLDDHIETTLDVLEGCVCLLFSYKKWRTDIWVMKEYGVKESWTKVFRVSYIYAIAECYCLEPCLTLPSGDILFLTRESLVVYNPKDDTLKFFDVRRSSSSFEPLVYVQSLVSPIPLVGRGEENKAGLKDRRN